MQPIRALLLFLAFTLCAALTASAGNWPQILGPQRNGVAPEETIAAWPQTGPKVLWKREAGDGYAGVAVVGGKAVLFHRIKNEEIAAGLDAATGETLWRAAFPTRFVSQYSSDHGPRATPTIAEGRVFLYGAGGNLHCVALQDGQRLWSRDLMREYGASEGYFGAGSSPILIEGKLLVNVGGDRQDAGIVALDPATGKTLWTATEEQASYASPVAATVGGRRQAVFVTRYHALGIDPKDGTVYWRIPFGKRGPTVNGANPLVLDGHVFLTSSYGVGAVYADVSGGEAEVEWSNDRVMSSQYTTPVGPGEHLFGIDGRHDIPPAHLRCFDPKSGEALWTREDFGKAALLLAGDKLLAQTTAGELVLIEASPQSYRELARAKVAESSCFALPALSDGLLYVRGPGELKCLDLRRR